jgi:hypothetical protein
LRWLKELLFFNADQLSQHPAEVVARVRNIRRLSLDTCEDRPAQAIQASRSSVICCKCSTQNSEARYKQLMDRLRGEEGEVVQENRGNWPVDIVEIVDPGARPNTPFPLGWPKT